MLVGYALSFVSAPLIVAGLGLREFGIWALTGGLAQYAGLLDFGVGRALSRFVALHDAQNDDRAVGQVMVIGLLTTATLAAPVTLAAVVAAPTLAKALGGISTAEMQLVLLSSTAILLFNLLTRVVAAYPLGLQRMVRPNIALIIGSGVNFCLSVGAVLAGARLPAYALANAAAGGIGFLAMLWITSRLPTGLPLALPTRARFKEVLVFSTKGQLVFLADLANYQSDKVVIALAIGPRAAGAYELANRVASAGRAVGVQAMSAMLPAMTAQIASSSLAATRQRYVRWTRTSASISFPVLFLCAALAPPLLGAWLGTAPKDGPVVLVVLSLAYLVNVSSGVGALLATAAGEPGLPARTSVATALANIALTAALAPLFGLWGVLIGTFAALTAGGFAQVLLVERRLKIPSRSYRSAVIAPFILSATLAIPVALAAQFLPHSSRLAQALFCGTAALVFGALYVATGRRFALLPHALDRIGARVSRWSSGERQA